MGISRIPPLFWSMIYLALKFKFNAIVSFSNRALISIASKSWTRIECGILVPIHAPCRYFSDFWVLNPGGHLT